MRSDDQETKRNEIVELNRMLKLRQSSKTRNRQSFKISVRCGLRRYSRKADAQYMFSRESGERVIDMKNSY